MVALSRPFTAIADSAVDPDSPVTTTLMVALQENDIHLEEWLGASATSEAAKAQDHAHAGFAVDGTAIVTTVALVFDQATGGSGSAASSTFVDVATITVASADLPSNRDAMIVSSGDIDVGGGGLPAIGNLRLLVDGVAKQTIAFRFNTANDRIPFALSQIESLTTGSDRIIKTQINVTSGGGVTASNTNLFSVLIT